MRTLLDRGVPVALATDNVPVSLFWPIWQTVARRCRYVDEPIAPEQAVGREEALACATCNGAWLTFEEHERGRLAEGFLADVAVLSNDPLAVAEDAIKDIRAELTLVGGAVVYERAEGT